jgi:hypothetical protein
LIFQNASNHCDLNLGVKLNRFIVKNKYENNYSSHLYQSEYARDTTQVYCLYTSFSFPCKQMFVYISSQSICDWSNEHHKGTKREEGQQVTRTSIKERLVDICS